MATLVKLPPPGVTFVIPVLNGARWLDRVIDAVRQQAHTGPIEIVVVEDGSTDGSRELLERRAAVGHLRLVDGPRRGAAAALNAGIEAASYRFIAQVDQDVVLEPGWLPPLLEALKEPGVAATQGHSVMAQDADIWSRVMALDLAQHYARLGPTPDYVCAGNAVFRKAVLMAVEGFDEALSSGYDNDLSYRIAAHEWQLAYRPEAKSVRHRRGELAGYFRYQYEAARGRLELAAKHPERASDNDVLSRRVMLHVPLVAAALVLAVAALGLFAAGVSVWPFATVLALAVAGVSAGERMIAGVEARVRLGTPDGLLLVPGHLVRDVAWAAAVIAWHVRSVRPHLKVRPSVLSTRHDGGPNL